MATPDPVMPPPPASVCYPTASRPPITSPPLTLPLHRHRRVYRSHDVVSGTIIMTWPELKVPRLGSGPAICATLLYSSPEVSAWPWTGRGSTARYGPGRIWARADSCPPAGSMGREPPSPRERIRRELSVMEGGRKGGSRQSWREGRKEMRDLPITLGRKGITDPGEGGGGGSRQIVEQRKGDLPAGESEWVGVEGRSPPRGVREPGEGVKGKGKWSKLLVREMREGVRKASRHLRKEGVRN